MNIIINKHDRDERRIPPQETVHEVFSVAYKSSKKEPMKSFLLDYDFIENMPLAKGSYKNCTGLNIRSGGIYLETSEEIEKNKELEVIISLPYMQQSATIHGTGTVTRCEKLQNKQGVFGVGLRFMPKLDSKGRYQDCIEYLKSRLN